MAVKTSSQKEMTLEKCTKAQLIQIIKWLDPMNRQTSMYLNDLQTKQHLKILDKMDELAHKAYHLGYQAAELLKPYEGKMYSEIPSSVLTQAEALMVEADKTRDEWGKLSKRVGP